MLLLLPMKQWMLCMSDCPGTADIQEVVALLLSRSWMLCMSHGPSTAGIQGSFQIDVVSTVSAVCELLLRHSWAQKHCLCVLHAVLLCTLLCQVLTVMMMKSRWSVMRERKGASLQLP